MVVSYYTDLSLFIYSVWRDEKNMIGCLTLRNWGQSIDRINKV